MRVWLQVPGDSTHCGFDDPRAAHYASLLVSHLGTADSRTAWLYTPMALPLATALDAGTTVFDVMDDLASFAHAPNGLRTMHRRALEGADVVFTGGRSLQRSVTGIRPDALCFPSGVEVEHYSSAVELRASTNRARPVAGYIGVVDERLDLDLVRDLSAHLHDWDIQVVGPLAKIDAADLPCAPNISYFGPRPYCDLPAIMAGFDVALMPFALNEATRSISPTKSLEYLAAGLPVVSTRVPDVVSELSHVVELEDHADGFARACRNALKADRARHHRAVRPLLRWNQWDTIAARMQTELEACDRPRTEAASS